MPITKTTTVSHTLVGLKGSLTGSDGELVFARAEDGVVVNPNVVLVIPAAELLPVLQEAIPQSAVGTSLGDFLAEKAMTWAVDNGHIPGEVS